MGTDLATLMVDFGTVFPVQGAQFEVILDHAKGRSRSNTSTARRSLKLTGDQLLHQGRNAYALGSGGAFPRSSRSVLPGCVECSEAPPGGTQADPTTRHQSFWVRHHRPDVAVGEGPRGSSPEWRGLCQALPTSGDRRFARLPERWVGAPGTRARSPCAPEAELRPRERTRPAACDILQLEMSGQRKRGILARTWRVEDIFWSSPPRSVRKASLIPKNYGSVCPSERTA